MERSQATAQFKALQKRRMALLHMNYLLSFDGDTIAPKGSTAGRSAAMGVLAEYSHALMTGEETAALLAFLQEHRQALDAQTARELDRMAEDCAELTCIPQAEYVAYNELLNEATAVWNRAKEARDFRLFAPYLERILEDNRRFAACFDQSRRPYDVLLDKNEKGMSTKMLDAFFDPVRAQIVPLLAAVAEAEPIDDSFLHQTFPVERQRELSACVMDVMGLPREHCILAETEHPFTTGFNKWDVRITTHYYEDNLTAALFSVLHEGGHALYELGTADELEYTCLRGGASTGLHESQSRFYENYLGRSEAFLTFLFPTLQTLFPEQLAGVDAHAFYRAVNKAQPSLIRIQADELTYPLHIMVRYELEKRLMDGSLPVGEVPDAWNQMYEAYLGVKAPDDGSGCLQDIHWANGLIGYFPSYALGSAYAAQLHAAMSGELDVDALAQRGDVGAVTAWLGEHLHRYGGMADPAELIERACGAPFDGRYYTDYLKEKYTKLYHL